MEFPLPPPSAPPSVNGGRERGQPNNIVYTLIHSPGGAELYVTVGVAHGFVNRDV